MKEQKTRFIWVVLFQILLLILICGVAVAMHEGASSKQEGAVEGSRESSHENADITKWCSYLAEHLLSVNKQRCISRDWKVEVKSPGGLPIPYLYWGATDDELKSSPNDFKKILVLGAIHGDEIVAVSVVFRWIDFLDKVKKDSFLRKKRYLFFPLVNPDGFYANPRTRTNKNGVDLNRNFATSSWDSKAKLYWKSRTKSDPRRNPGPNSASEIEAQLVQKSIDEFKPDLIISVHAPYNVLDHDGPIEFPDLRSPIPVKTLGAYPGSLGTYAGVEKGIPVVTPEFPKATMLPKPKEIEDLFVFIMKAKY